MLNSALPARECGASPRHSASLGRRPPCARSSKRAGGFIPRIALDQCRDPERYRTRAPFSISDLRYTIYACRAKPCAVRFNEPSRQSPIVIRKFQAGVVQQQNVAVPRPRRRCDSVHPLHFGGVAHQQSARLTCERQRGRHSPLPPFRPCGVVQPTRLPLMQENTGAKPVRDAISAASKALSAMRSLGKRISPVQFRVEAPISGGHAPAPQSSQRSGRFHTPAASGAAPGTAIIFKRRLPAAACGLSL